MKNKKSIRLSENLRRLLKEERTTANSIAYQLNINKSTLHNWENGILPKSLLALLKLADYFEVSLAELVYENPDDKIYHQLSIEGKYEIIIKKISRRPGDV